MGMQKYEKWTGGASLGAKQVKKKAVFQSGISLWATGFPSDSPTSGTTTASYISASYQPRRRRGLIARAPTWERAIGCVCRAVAMARAQRFALEQCRRRSCLVY